MGPKSKLASNSVFAQYRTATPPSEEPVQEDAAFSPREGENGNTTASAPTPSTDASPTGRDPEKKPKIMRIRRRSSDANSGSNSGTPRRGSLTQVPGGEAEIDAVAAALADGAMTMTDALKDADSAPSTMVAPLATNRDADVWDRANADRENAASGAEEAPSQVDPISFAEALYALRADERRWKPHLGSIKRVSLHLEEQSAFWNFCWSCAHTEIEDGSDDGEDRDFVLCLTHVELDHSNSIHRRMLLTVHRKLTKPNRRAADVPTTGNHWEALGFQGMNPGTDLRSSGLFGLLQMLYLTEYFPPFCTMLFNCATNPMMEFPFALVSLAWTAISLEALKDKALHDEIHKRRKLGPPKGFKGPQKFEKGMVVPAGGQASGRNNAAAVGSATVESPMFYSPVVYAMNEFFVGLWFKFFVEWRKVDSHTITDFPPIKAKLRPWARDHAGDCLKEAANAGSRTALKLFSKKDEGPKEELEFTEF